MKLRTSEIGRCVSARTVPFLFLLVFSLCQTFLIWPFVCTARANLEGTDGYVRISSPEILRPGVWSVGLFGNYYRRPSPVAPSVTENFAVGQLGGRFGIAKTFEIFAFMPGDGTLWQYKKLSGRDEQSVNRGGVGDARLGLKMQVPFESERYALAFDVAASIPTGRDAVVFSPAGTAGEKLFTAGTTNILAHVSASVDLSDIEALSPLKIVADFGYRLNREKGMVRFPSYLFSIPGSVDNKDMFVGGLALVFPTPYVTLFTELYTEQFVQSSHLTARRENPFFLTPGAKVTLPYGLVLTAGVDVRLSTNDPLTAFDPETAFPEWGATLGLDFIPEFFTNDTDEDGVPDMVDKCPNEPGTKANEGCPEKSGMEVPPRVRPVSPAPGQPAQQVQPVPQGTTQPTPQPGVQPESQQGTETGQQPGAQPAQATEPKSVPPVEIDSDNDGIPDSRDKCPTLAEDIDGYEDDDGCPEIDSDGDGIPDAIDKCPDLPGPKTNSGCPTK